jgi:hypothetical protein
MGLRRSASNALPRRSAGSRSKTQNVSMKIWFPFHCTRCRYCDKQSCCWHGGLLGKMGVLISVDGNWLRPIFFRSNPEIFMPRSHVNDSEDLRKRAAEMRVVQRTER